MIVVTGPTGSGKTTTLATVLSVLNEPTRKILTIEDPVEYEIPGINQSQAKPAIGLTFAAAHARIRPPGPRRHHGRRGARCRDRAHRDPRRPDGPSGADHAAHRDGGRRGAAPARSRRRGLPAQIDAARRDRPAAGAPAVRPLQGQAERSPRPTSPPIRVTTRWASRPAKRIYEPGGCERCGGTGYRGRRRRVRGARRSTEERARPHQRSDRLRPRSTRPRSRPA